MKTKHTPGPWSVHWGQGTHQLDELRIYGPKPKPNQKPIALVSTIGPDFSHADADLIAAAPEMLAALKLLLSRMETGSGENAIHLSAETYDAIAEAIVKAQGRL